MGSLGQSPLFKAQESIGIAMEEGVKRSYEPTVVDNSLETCYLHKFVVSVIPESDGKLTDA